MALRDFFSVLRSRRSPDSVAPGVDLLVVRGNDAGRRFSVFASHASIVGASSGDPRAVWLRDPSVSPQQAVVHRREEGFELEHDARARLPTRVNGEPIERRRIEPGDRIEIGDVVLEVRQRTESLSGIFELSDPPPDRSAPSARSDVPEAASLETAPLSATLATRASAAGGASDIELEVVSGAAPLRAPLLEGSTSIGRSHDCDLSFPDEPSISREHALIERRDDRLELHHLSAVNTTRLNGDEIHGTRTLGIGDRIELAERVVVQLVRPATTGETTRPVRSKTSPGSSGPADPASGAGNLRDAMESVIERRQQIEDRFSVDASFLDVDVVGSFALKRMTDEPERIVVSFERWREWVAEQIRAHRGEVLNCNGDELMALFEEPVDAVRAGRQILRDLGAFNDAENLLAEPFRLRIGIHSGRSLVDRQRGVAYSEVLDLAGHLQKEAEVDGLLISQATLDGLGSELPADLAFEAAEAVDGMATHRLRREPDAS